MTDQLLAGEVKEAVNAAAQAEAVFRNSKLVVQYTLAMQNYFQNLRRAADNNLPPPTRPEVPNKWITVEDTVTVGEGLLTLAQSPVEYVCDPIPDPAPPAPAPQGVAKLGPEIPAPADVPGERWFMALAGDTVAVGTRIQRDGRTYERRERHNPFGAAPYYVLVG